jgi:WD40 repeat protein
VAIARRADPDAAIDGRIFAQAAAFDLHSPVWSLAFSPAGDKLASTTLSSEVWLMEDARAAQTLIRKTRMNVVRSLAFSPDGQVLAIGGPGRVVRLVDTSSASDVWGLEADGDDNASEIAISPDGRYLAVGGCGGTVTVWDRNGRRRRGALAGPNAITALGFAPDSRALAVGDEMGGVRLWAVPDGTTRIIQPAAAPFSGVTALAFSPDGASLASLSKVQSEARLWDPSDGRLRTIIRSGAAQVRALAFSPDGALLAMAQSDGGAMLWGLAEGRELALVRANGCALQCAAFSADGRLLATGGTDGRLRLWDVALAVGGGR